MTKFLSVPFFVGSIFAAQLSFAQTATTPSTTSPTPSSSKSGSTTTTKSGKGSTSKDSMPSDTKASNLETGPNRADCAPTDQGKPSQNPNCAGQQNVDPSTSRNTVTPTTPGINNKKSSTPTGTSTQGN